MAGVLLFAALSLCKMATPLTFDTIEITHSIDVCPSNGNLLATNTEKDIKIFDKRGSTIVKTFDKVHSSRIRLTSYLNFLRL